MFKQAIALLLAPLVMGSAFPRQSATPPPNGQAVDQTVVTFAPPLGTPLRHRMTLEQTSKGKPETRVIEQDLTFERGADGAFILSMMPVRVTLSDGSTHMLSGPRATPLPPAIRAMIGPYSYDLDANGMVLRMREWERVRAQMLAATDDIVRMADAAHPGQRSTAPFMQTGLSAYAKLDAAQAAETFLKDWLPVFGLGGTVIDGGPVTGETTIATPFSQALVPAVFTAEAASMRPGNRIRYTQSVTMDRAKAGQLIIDTLRRMVPDPTQLSASERANLAKAEADMKQIELTTEVESIADRTTGLPDRLVTTFHLVGAGGEKASRRVTIERVHPAP